MVATGPRVPIEQVSSDFFDILTRVCLAVPRGRRRDGDLKEIEFLTLSLLDEYGTMIVGDIQRLLGVLPAQMSRVIRSLEARTTPLIACRINPKDKRKIDVELTPDGERSLHDYQAVRVRRITELLSGLPEEVREDLNRVLPRLSERVHGLRDLSDA